MADNAITSYKDYNGDEVQLAKVYEFISATCPQATPAEVELFIARCRAGHLNPFLKDAYLVKYGDRPASIIVSKDALVKRADKMDAYDGMEHGVTVLTRDGQIIDREGQACYGEIGETLIGAWCRVYRKDRRIPITAKVSLSEFNQGRAQWKTMPAVMIDKVAQTTALRSAFPQDFSGMYEAAEMDEAQEPARAVEAVEPERVDSQPEPARQESRGLTDEERVELRRTADALGGERKHQQMVWDAYKAGGMDAVRELLKPEPVQDAIDF